MLTYGNDEQEYREDWRWPQAGDWQAYPAEGEGDVARPGHASAHQALAQDEQGPPVNRDGLPEVYEDEREPYFPSAPEAIDLNKEAYANYGQKEWGGVLKPNELDSAVNAAKQHYYYGPEEDEAERLAVAAGKMGWRMAGSQIFRDGNKRTAIWLTRHFLDQNGLGHVAPYTHDDYELADHLINQDNYQVEEKNPEALRAERERLEHEYLELFRNRYFQGGPQAAQGPDGKPCRCGHCVGEPYQQRFPEGTYQVRPELPRQMDDAAQAAWENEGGAYMARWKGIAWELRDPWVL